MSRPLWVKWWVGDLYSDSWYMLLPGPERGMYLQLLVLQAVLGGFLPSSTEAIARLANCDHDKFLPLWERVSEKFDDHPEGYANKRMLLEVREAEARTRAASDRANLRWHPKRKHVRRRKPKQ